MNIFFLDENPRLAAQYHNDTHVNKQIVESCQILSTAIWINNYKDHPVYKDLTKRAKTDEEREYMKQVKQQWKDETGLYVPEFMK